jgi:hypothetical protein
MEFIDGDDLSSLLRRIGRLPPDKAVEIARLFSNRRVVGQTSSARGNCLESAA